MGNRRTSRSASKRSTSLKGATKGKGATRERGHAKPSGGPRKGKGWSGPSGKQVRGSNTRSRLQHPKDPQEEGERKGPKVSRATAPDPGRQGPSRAQAPRRRSEPGRAAEKGEGGEPRPSPKEGPQETPEVTVVESDVHGPERIEDLRSRADQMVVGERTVIHHAARYGIVRGMTWTVILSALLFWLPVAGPAVAGYVGGRKAGGPLRGVIAVAIPAVVMLVILAAISEGSGLLPSSLVGNTDINFEGLGEVPASAVPLIGSIQSSIEAWITSPPDIFFIMAVFAIVGGALSSLRRREEETVIEKVGIPLGELKERILNEEAGRTGKGKMHLPARWEPHPIISGPAAAHDAVNEMVEDIVHRVVQYLQDNGTGEQPSGPAPAKARHRARAKVDIPTGGEGPHYSEMVRVDEASTEAKSATAPKRSRKGAVAGRASPRTAQEAIVGDEEDWTVVDTSKGRRPVRVVHSPVDETPMEARAATPAPGPAPTPASAPSTTYLAEPEMHVETRPRGIFRRPRQTIVYSPAEPSRSPLGEDGSVPTLGGEPALAWGPADVDMPEEAAPRRARRDFDRLPIIGPIMESVEVDGVGRSGRLTSLEEPSVHDAMEAGSIAESVARELAEMARYEDGPDMEPEEDLMPPEARSDLPLAPGEARLEVEPEPEPDMEPVARPLTKPRPKSTARKVKHPTGALKSRGKAKRAVEDAVYDEDMAEEGEVDWEAPDQVEGEDMFNPRRLVDDDGGGPEEGSEDWAEEERIAALVREREEWDRL